MMLWGFCIGAVGKVWFRLVTDCVGLSCQSVTEFERSISLDINHIEGITYIKTLANIFRKPNCAEKPYFCTHEQWYFFLAI